MGCNSPGATHHLACDCREDAICKEVAGLRERLAASEKAREEAERRFAVISPAGHAIDYAAWVAAMDQIERHRLDFTNCADVGRRMEVRALAAESRAERLEEALRAIAEDECHQTTRDVGAHLDTCSEERPGDNSRWCAVCIASSALGEEGK